VCFSARRDKTNIFAIADLPVRDGTGGVAIDFEE